MSVESGKPAADRELRVLILEDVIADAELCERELQRAGLRFRSQRVDRQAAYEAALDDFAPDLIISDFSLPGAFDGLAALDRARSKVPEVPFVFVSGTIGEERAVEAMKGGATDYVLKDRLSRLVPVIKRALAEAEERAARRRNEEALRESEYRLDLALQASGLAVWDLNLATEEVRFSRHWWPILGYEPDEISLRIEAWEKLTHPDDLARVKSSLVATVKGSVPVLDVEYRMRAKSGEWLWIRTVGRVVERDAAGQALRMTGTHGDVTERRLQQERIARLSRIHAVLSGINSAIVRIRDRQELFNEAVRIAVEHGGFGMAWIGAYDPAAQEVTPVAWAGLEASEYLGGVKSIIRDDHPQGRGVLAQAIRSRKPVIDNDITLDPAVGGKRRAEAIRRGYRSVVVLPLIVEGKVMGSLSLLANELNFFDDEELKLLTELAGDVSFALEHMAGQEKIEKLSRVRAVSSGINAAIVRVRERQALLEETCRIAAEQGKFEMVWIGEISPEKQAVRLVAWRGFSSEAAHAVSWASISAVKGTLGEAMRTRKPAVRNDIGAELPSGKLRQEALARGCLSTVSLPLEVDGNVAALIVLFASGKGFFVEDELALLAEVASNISFALGSIARQEKIERLSRIRAVLGEMNAAIVRIRSRQQLFEEACRIAQEHGKFTMSWIGMLDEATQAIKPVAKAGRDEGYLERLKLTIDPNITRNLAMAVEAIARGAPVICNDIATDGRMRPWRTAALERGYRSMVMLPLLLEQRAVGVFALYSPKPGVFDEEEMKLLIELAGDIAFALQTIGKQEKLDYLSYYDTLTGLPNRTLFIDRAGQQMHLRSGDPVMVALVLLNLERFRNINETFGRNGGDDLLMQVARRLEAAFHGKDYLARTGADGFGVVIRGIRDAAGAMHAVESQILGCFRDPFQLSGSEVRVAAKMGIALFPSDGKDADLMFRNAEAALKKAQGSGERYLFYAADMNARAAQVLSLETLLRKAVEARQFVLHYQPKIELAGGSICGLEALIRWQEPGGGLVAPGAFIPILEETGLILEVGKWALEQALEQHREWTARGCPAPRIAVNVSPIQLQQPGFANMVIEAVQKEGDNSGALELEVTESLLMKDVQDSIRKLSILRGMGIQIAMDDFGTGYSSLSYIARLPINSVKIDRSFIAGMVGGPQDMSIVTTIIALAHSLNLKVVAEGVETGEQSQLLKLLRCDEAQGFLFSKPLPAGEIEAKLRAGI